MCNSGVVLNNALPRKEWLNLILEPMFKFNRNHLQLNFKIDLGSKEWPSNTASNYISEIQTSSYGNSANIFFTKNGLLEWSSF